MRISLFSQEMQLRHFGTQEGLPATDIFQVLQDSKGYIWFATNYGVSRFNGYNFTNYDEKSGLADNTILELFEDYKGRIWFISNSGKHSYYFNDTIFKYWNNDVFIKTVKDRPAIVNKSFYVDEQDNISFGIYLQGIYKISKSGQITKKYPKDTRIKGPAIYAEKSGTYFDFNPGSFDSVCILKDHSVFYLKIKKIKIKVSSGIHLGAQGGNGEIYYSDNSTLYCVDSSLRVSDCSFAEKKIVSIYKDKSNNIWVGTYLGGVFCFKNGKLNNKPDLHFLEGKTVSSVLCDNEGGYWFSTLNDGAYYMPSLNYKTLSISEGLNDKTINYLTSDGKSRVWAATSGQCINEVSDGGIKKIKLFNTNEIRITAIYYDKTDSVLWIGTSKAIYYYKDGLLKTFPFYIRKSTSKIIIDQYNTNEIVKGSDGNIWLGTNIGVLKVSNGQVVQYDTKNIFFRINSLQEETDGSFWYGSQDGLNKFSKGEYTCDGNKNLLLKSKITFVRKNTADNSLWLATKGEGIIILKGNSVKQILQKDGLTSNYVKHLFISGNTVWAATNNGLNKIGL